MIRPAAALALLPLLAACASTSSSGTSSPQGGSLASLEGTTWVLTTSLGGMSDTGPAKAQIDIRFEGGRVSGSSGCNHYGGSYTLDGSSLSFGPLASTAMACPEPVMTIESQYLGALAKVDRYTVASDGKVMSLTGPSVELAYRAEAPVADLPLTGTTWRLTTIGGANGTVSSTLAGTALDAVFAADGAVSGSDGCNGYHGPYTAEQSGAVSIGPIGATKMACAQDVMDQANAFVSALAMTRSYAIDGTTLTLSDAGGAPLLVFDGASGAI